MTRAELRTCAAARGARDPQLASTAHAVERYLTSRENLCALLLVMDIRRAPADEERLLVDFTSSRGLGLLLVLAPVMIRNLVVGAPLLKWAVLGSTAYAMCNTASASLTVNAPHPAISVAKRVGLSPTGPWVDFLSVAPLTPLYYQFTAENTLKQELPVAARVFLAPETEIEDRRAWIELDRFLWTLNPGKNTINLTLDQEPLFAGPSAFFDHVYQVAEGTLLEVLGQITGARC